MNRAFKTIKKLEKSGRRSKVITSPSLIKIKILVTPAMASMTGASTGASSTHDVPIVRVDDDGALTASPCSLPDQNTTSGS